MNWVTQLNIEADVGNLEVRNNNIVNEGGVSKRQRFPIPIPSGSFPVPLPKPGVGKTVSDAVKSGGQTVGDAGKTVKSMGDSVKQVGEDLSPAAQPPQPGRA